MMRSTVGPLTLCLTLLFPACSRIYLPGGFDMTPPAVTPISMKESAEHAGVAVNYSGGFNPNESNMATELSYAWGNGGGWYKFGARGFLYGGSYGIDGTYKGLSGSQSYFGLGGLGEANVGLPLGKVTLGIGVTLGMMTEFGPYTRLYLDSASIGAWPLGSGYYFMTITPDDRTQFGLQLGAGSPGAIYLAGNFFYDRWGGTIGVGAGEDDENNDVPDLGRFTLGLSYRVR